MNKLAVARLGKSVGLRGFVRFFDLSDFGEQFKKGAKFLGEKGEIYTLKAVDKRANALLIEGFESVELAKSLTNKMLFKSEEATRKEFRLKKGEYFYFDILGCKVFETRAFEKVDLNFENSACGAGQLRDSAATEIQGSSGAEPLNLTCEKDLNLLFLGEIKDILETSASHLFLIKTATELVKQGFASEFYIPYADFYIQKIDIQNKAIHTQNAFALLESLK